MHEAGRACVAPAESRQGVYSDAAGKNHFSHNPKVSLSAMHQDGRSPLYTGGGNAN